MTSYHLQIALAAVLAAFATSPSLSLAKEAQELRVQLRAL